MSIYSYGVANTTYTQVFFRDFVNINKMFCITVNNLLFPQFGIMFTIQIVDWAIFSYIRYTHLSQIFYWSIDIFFISTDVLVLPV